jgi:regulator of cell morphogenesis and NO signaling
MSKLLSPETTVGQLVAERPARSQVFERLGIDYCCGGRKTLTASCAERGLSTNAVLSALADADQNAPAAADTDPARMGISELCDHIEETHHAHLRETLPRLMMLTDKVANAHGERNANLIAVRDLFIDFRAELEAHMMKEEMILFPLCRQMEAATGPVRAHCGSVANPIRVMFAEHDDAGEAMEKFRAWTNDYTAPDGACNTYRAMLDALATLEADMHQHVHKENNILFPRAIEREAELAQNAPVSVGKE